MNPKPRSSAAVLSGAALLATSLVATAVTTAAPTAGEEARAGMRLEAQLHGGSSGDPDGTGHAEFRLYKGAGRVCVTEVDWAKIETPNAAHIHRKSDGAVRVNLTGSVTGGPKCATGVKPRLIKRIVNHPRRYYFNIHNATYPAGAIRGTLHR